MLVAVGRVPNGRRIDAEAAGVAVDARGFIAVDKQLRTNVPHIFAIGDVVGQPMLAHKADARGQGCGGSGGRPQSPLRCPRDPVGRLHRSRGGLGGPDRDRREGAGLAYGKGTFPWAASGRSLAMGRDEGFTKLLFDPETHRVLGGGIVGPNAGELIARNCARHRDGRGCGRHRAHHPSAPDAVGDGGSAAEAFEGTLTDLYIPRKS